MDETAARRFRKITKTTVPAITEAIGISPSAYRNKENGINPWTFEEIERLAAFYGISVLDFTKGHNSSSGLIIEENNQLKKLIQETEEALRKGMKRIT